MKAKGCGVPVEHAQKPNTRGRRTYLTLGLGIHSNLYEMNERILIVDDPDRAIPGLRHATRKRDFSSQDSVEALMLRQGHKGFKTNVRPSLTV